MLSSELDDQLAMRDHFDKSERDEPTAAGTGEVTDPTLDQVIVICCEQTQVAH